MTVEVYIVSTSLRRNKVNFIKAIPQRLSQITLLPDTWCEESQDTQVFQVGPRLMGLCVNHFEAQLVSFAGVGRTFLYLGLDLYGYRTLRTISRINAHREVKAMHYAR